MAPEWCLPERVAPPRCEVQSSAVDGFVAVAEAGLDVVGQGVKNGDSGGLEVLGSCFQLVRGQIFDLAHAARDVEARLGEVGASFPSDHDSPSAYVPCQARSLDQRVCLHASSRGGEESVDARELEQDHGKGDIPLPGDGPSAGE
eukprot:7782484-Heterocapsa_arctica.AAC.1